jgi:hypothetical protein
MTKYKETSDFCNTDNPAYGADTAIRSSDIVVEFYVNETGNVCGGRFRKLEPGEITMYQMLRRTTERPPPPDVVMPLTAAGTPWPVDAGGRGLSIMEVEQMCNPIAHPQPSVAA